MSRSVKHSPFCGFTTAESEKSDKKMWHRALRSKEKIRLSKTLNNLDEIDSYIPLTENDAINPWCMAKDGKHRLRVSNDTWVKDSEDREHYEYLLTCMRK
jgi:hypothetical protein